MNLSGSNSAEIAHQAAGGGGCMSGVGACVTQPTRRERAAQRFERQGLGRWLGQSGCYLASDERLIVRPAIEKMTGEEWRDETFDSPL